MTDVRSQLAVPALVCLAAAAALLRSLDVSAASDAVIFMYHHVDSGTPASTSVTPETFDAHLELLESEGFSVVPLLETLETLRSGGTVPERSVVITFDDGYRSVLTEAYDELRQRGWPFTVFVSPEYVDRGYGSYLSWDELRRLADGGATIGNHTLTHAHLVRRKPDESDAAWRDRVSGEITAGQRRIDAELGDAGIPVLAYPYGEFDAEVAGIVRDLQMFALGQHSGAVGEHSDWFAVPRYPVATGFDDLSEFSLRARTKPLRLRVDDGTDTINTAADGRPALRALLLDADVRRAELACFATGQGRMELEWLDAAQTRFVALPRRALAPGRTKYNCTAPSATESGVYHWHSQLWLTRNEDGSWYEE